MDQEDNSPPPVFFDAAQKKLFRPPLWRKGDKHQH